MEDVASVGVVMLLELLLKLSNLIQLIIATSLDT